MRPSAGPPTRGNIPPPRNAGTPEPRASRARRFTNGRDPPGQVGDWTPYPARAVPKNPRSLSGKQPERATRVSFSLVGSRQGSADHGQYPGANGFREIGPRGNNLAQIGREFGPIWGPILGSDFGSDFGSDQGTDRDARIRRATISPICFRADCLEF